jgi:hypothetical protein
MLIMVDDKTTRRGLLEKNTHPTSEGILNELLAGGYIETVGGTGLQVPRPPRPRPQPARRNCYRSGCRVCRCLVRIRVTLRLPYAGGLCSVRAPTT